MQVDLVPRVKRISGSPGSPSRRGLPGRHTLLFLLLLTVVLPSLSAQSSLDLARQAIGRGDWEAAEVHYRDVVAGGHDLGEAHYYLAQIVARKGFDPEVERQVIQHFQQALENRAGDEVIWKEYASWLLSHQYVEDAVEAYQKLIELQPAATDYQVRLGLAQYNNRDPELALQTFRRVLSNNPEQVDATVYCGIVLRALNELDEAEKLFRQALALDPGRTDAHLQLGQLLLETGRPEESLPHLQGVELAEADYGRGMAFFQLDRYPEALTAFQQLLAKQPDHTQGHYQLGRLYSRLGNREKAQEHFTLFRDLEARDRESRRVRETKSIVRRPNN